VNGAKPSERLASLAGKNGTPSDNNCARENVSPSAARTTPVKSRHTSATGGSPVPAVITKIDRMKTRQGDSLFLNVDVGGETVRVFGRPEELGLDVGAEAPTPGAPIYGMTSSAAEILRFAQDDKSLFAVSFLDDGVGLDFHEHLRRDQLAHLHHAGCRTDFLEEFAVRPADFLPLFDISDEDSCADYVRHGGSSALQRRLDVAQRLERLQKSIANPNNLSIGARCRRTRYADVIANAHGTGVTHDKLPGRSAGDVLSWHVDFSVHTRKAAYFLMPQGGVLN